MKKLSVSRPKRRISFDHNEQDPENNDVMDAPSASPRPRVSFDHNEYALSKPSPRLKMSFDHNEYSIKSNKSRAQSSAKSPKSRHGFFSEFEIVTPAALTSTYSIRSLKPGPDETYRDKYACSLSSVLPILKWLPSYELAWLKPDFMAAIIVSILQVPQVLAYATLAGLPPEWGLYASIVPVFLYAIWSTTTKVAVGPGAPSAIMLASAVNGVIAGLGMTSSDEGYEEIYQEIAMTFTFCCGIIFIVLGLMRAGFVVVFLSRPVMTGFILSASFIIVLSQCRSLMGLDIGRYPIFYINFIAVIENIGTIHWWTTLISCCNMLILFMPRYIKGIPRWVPLPLIVIFVNILLSWLLDFESLGVDIVGAEIKAGFPMPKIPNCKYLGLVFPSALVVTVVDYMSNIVLANSFEQKTKDTYQQQLTAYNNYVRKRNEHDDDDDDEDVIDMEMDIVDGKPQKEGTTQSMKAKSKKKDKQNEDEQSDKGPQKPVRLAPIDVDANMEFIAYGIANLFGSWFSSQIISASFSRTALNYEMGAQTRIAGLIRVIICVLCLLFLMPFISPLPKCALASIVMTAIYGLIKSGIEEFRFLCKVSKLELFEFMVSVLAPLIIGMEMGIFLAIATSIMVNLLRHTFASVIFLGRLQTNQHDVEYVDCELFKEAKYVRDITIIEMKAELSFSNNLRLVNKIRELLSDNNKYIVVSLNLTSFIDTTAIRQIVTLFEDARESYICLSQCRPKVVELIRRYQQTADEFPPNVKTFVSTHDAVRYLQKIRREAPDYTSDDDDDDMDPRDLQELSLSFKLQGITVTSPISPEPPQRNQILPPPTMPEMTPDCVDNQHILPSHARV